MSNDLQENTDRSATSEDAPVVRVGTSVSVTAIPSNEEIGSTPPAAEHSEDEQPGASEVGRDTNGVYLCTLANSQRNS